MVRVCVDFILTAIYVKNVLRLVNKVQYVTTGMDFARMGVL